MGFQHMIPIRRINGVKKPMKNKKNPSTKKCSACIFPQTKPKKKNKRVKRWKIESVLTSWHHHLLQRKHQKKIKLYFKMSKQIQIFIFLQKKSEENQRIF
jgi:hypothetical protein